MCCFLFISREAEGKKQKAKGKKQKAKGRRQDVHQ